MDENLGGILKGFALMGLACYILPLLLAALMLIGTGIGIGWLIWG